MPAAGRGGASEEGKGLVRLADALRQAAAGVRADDSQPNPEPGASAPPSSAASLQRSNPLFEALGPGFATANPNQSLGSHASAAATDAGSATCVGAPAPGEELSATSALGAPTGFPDSTSAPEPVQEQQGSNAEYSCDAAALPPLEAGAGAEGLGLGTAGFDARAAALTPQDAAAGAEDFRRGAAGFNARAAALTPRAAAAGADLDAAPLALAFEHQAMLDERAELKSELRTISARVSAWLLQATRAGHFSNGP